MGNPGAEQTCLPKMGRCYKQATVVPCLSWHCCTRMLSCCPCGAKNTKRPSDVVGKAWALASHRPVMKLRTSHLLTVWLWWRHFISLSLSVPVCVVEIIIVFFKPVVRINLGPQCLVVSQCQHHLSFQDGVLTSFNTKPSEKMGNRASGSILGSNWAVWVGSWPSGIEWNWIFCKRNICQGTGQCS